MRQRNILTPAQSGSLHTVELGDGIALAVFTPCLFKITSRASLQRLMAQMRKKMLAITISDTKVAQRGRHAPNDWVINRAASHRDFSLEHAGDLPMKGATYQ
jgi:hypothetical protein